MDESDFSLDDSDDDVKFEEAPKPKQKAPVVKKAPKAPAKARAAPVVADSPLPKAKGTKRGARQSEDSPSAAVFSPAPPSAKPKKTKKRVEESEDEEFDDTPAAPAPARAPRAGRAKKAVVYDAGSDSDADEWAGDESDDTDDFVDSD